MKALSLNVRKLWPMLKFFEGRQINTQEKTIFPPPPHLTMWGIKSHSSGQPALSMQADVGQIIYQFQGSAQDVHLRHLRKKIAEGAKKSN